MTIDEAIKHCEKVIEQENNQIKDLAGTMSLMSHTQWEELDILDDQIELCSEWRKRYEQLAEWLKELKELREEKEKYKWHNLRENPNDLPECDNENGKIRVLFQIDTSRFASENEEDFYSGDYYIDFEDECFCNDDAEAYVTKGGYTIEEVLKWRYLE